ncbi:MAG: hypothetical protein K2G26_02060 [Clostridia bacterium]|nr:hypothetical protein [Clostridia bacterium]
MSRDKKIHNLIEQQDNKGKQENWAKIQSRLEESDGESGDVENGGNTRAVIFSKKAILYSICAAVLLVAVILLIVFVPRKPDGGNGLDGFVGSAEQYSTVNSEYTIKDYAEQTGNDFLYFNWYDQTEYCSNYVIKANNTQKTVCYEETIMDMETGYMISYYITGLKTDIDILKKFKDCKDIQNIKNTEIKWDDGITEDIATFEYKGFKYYIEIPDCESPEILLGYIEQLLA